MKQLKKHVVSKGLCTKEEYEAILKVVKSCPSANMLVFGLGYDSLLWLTTNKDGNTFFIEDDIIWIDRCSILPGIIKVAYRTEYWDNEKIYEDDILYMPLPKLIEKTPWDIILVDGPVGAIQGRMKSIYNAWRLAEKSLESGKTPAVFVHDYDRPSEQLYVNHFFRKYSKHKTGKLVRIQL